jgi:hypothetical protein
MATIKHGDTDGVLTFTLTQDGAPIDLTSKTAKVILKNRVTGVATTIDLVISSPATAGIATWTPSAANYVILRPGAYDVEVYTLTGALAKRTCPSAGVEEIIIEPTLA